MTEKEILDRQEATGNQEFFLILIGRFYHAYGNGAFALARVTGYQVRRVQRKLGEVLVLGFPVDRFDSVINKVRDSGGDMESIDSKTWRFHGLDGTPDEGLVSAAQPTAAEPQSRSDATLEPAGERAAADAATDWLADAVRHFDLSMATPMEAMMFLSRLKQRLQREADNSGM